MADREYALRLFGSSGWPLWQRTNVYIINIRIAAERISILRLPSGPALNCLIEEQLGFLGFGLDQTSGPMRRVRDRLRALGSKPSGTASCCQSER